MSPTIASLFSGGGLADVGALLARYTPIWGVEHDPAKPKLSRIIADYYERNLEAHVIRQPVQEVDWRQLESPTLLWASPPCTRYSGANTRAVESDLDLDLAIAVSRAIEILLPPAFCLENVRAYAKSRSLQLIRDPLNRLGYGISEHIIDAADYGVPQNRIRLFLRAVRNQTPPALPPPEARRIGWYEAISDLIPSLPDSKLAPWQQSFLSSFPWEPAGNYLIERAGARNKKTKVRQGSQPSWTIRAGIGTDQNGSNRNEAINALLENGRVVRLTPRALARLQTLPDWYVLPEEMRHAGPLVGNGVVCHISKMITESLLPVILPSELLIPVKSIEIVVDSICEVKERSAFGGCATLTQLEQTSTASVAKYETIGVEACPDSMLATPVGVVSPNVSQKESNTMNYTAEHAEQYSTRIFKIGDRVRVRQGITQSSALHIGRTGCVTKPTQISRGREDDFYVTFDKPKKNLSNRAWFSAQELELDEGVMSVTPGWETLPLLDPELGADSEPETEVEPDSGPGPESEPEMEPNPEPELEPEPEPDPDQESAFRAEVEVVEELSQEEVKDRHKLETRVEQAFYDAGCALRQLRDRRLYRDTHPSNFVGYCRDRFDISKQAANYLIAAAGVYENLATTIGCREEDGTTTNGCRVLPTNERQVRELAKLTPEEQVRLWNESVEDAGGKVPTERIVKSVVSRHKQQKKRLIGGNSAIYPDPVPYMVGEVVEIRAGSNPDLRRHDGMWGIVTHVGSFSCTVYVSLRNVELQCKSDEMDKVEEKYTENIRMVSERIKKLMKRDDLARTAIGMLEVLSRQVCFSEDDLWFLEKIEERYNMNHR